MIGLERRGRRGRPQLLLCPTADAELHRGDVLVYVADPDASEHLVSELGLETLEMGASHFARWREEAIDWSSVVLNAGMLPVADALERTGGVDLLAGGLLRCVGDGGPYLLMSLLFFLTAGLGLVLLNTATAVLVAPIAVRLAEASGISPYLLAMTVAIAASPAFVTPISTPS